VKSNIKTMLISFFVINGLVNHECVPTGQTANKEFYKTVLHRLRDAVCRHRPEKWRSGNWILHHNTPVHWAVTTNEFWQNTAFHRSHNLPTPQLRAITKSDYQRCFRQWQERWNKCIQAQGHYFEGDKTN
jgi:hypothetical protein